MEELMQFLDTLPIKEFMWIFGILFVAAFLITIAFIAYIFLLIRKDYQKGHKDSLSGEK